MTLRAHTNAFESICSATAMECSQIADDCRSMLRAAIPPFAGWSGAYIARCADLTAITNCLTRSSENCLNSQPTGNSQIIALSVVNYQQRLWDATYGQFVPNFR